MKDIIHQLPDYVANQIAAGEVIQRPCSVVKELVENAIDAGAKTIKVLIVDAGRTSIQVIDDGCGMSDTDARMSFERHATSKISEFSDMSKLQTMGFRGEALASIAAVAHVTLQTRRHDEELGTCVRINGSSTVASQEDVACAAGSNFIVENLFFNVPARRKFLKSNNVEMKNITDTFLRIVLVYPHVKFELYQNGQPTMKLPATTLLQRIVDVFGKSISKSLLPIENQTTVCSIKGYVGKPEFAKKKGAHQFFFVNGRFMKHPYFHSAVQKAVERLVPSGEQIPYFIYLTVGPEDLDVNIHPVKTEIKFTNEQAIWQLLLANVQNAIGRDASITELDFDSEGKPDIPPFIPGNSAVSQPGWDVDTSYNPFSEENDDGRSEFSQTAKQAKAPRYNTILTSSSRLDKKKVASLGDEANRAAMQSKGWEKLFGDIQCKSDYQTESVDLFPDVSAVGNETLTEDTAFMNEILEGRSHEYIQYRGSYIVLQIPTGLLMIDQCRADTQIRYEDYMKALKDKTSHVQRMLYPEIISFPPNYGEQLDGIVLELTKLGFEITDMGGMSYQLSGYPAGLDGLDPLKLVEELVDAAVNKYSKVDEEVNTLLAQELAAKSAIPYGQVLSVNEIEDLISRLLQCKSFRYTFNGKKIMTTISNNYVESLF